MLAQSSAASTFVRAAAGAASRTAPLLLVRLAHHLSNAGSRQPALLHQSSELCKAHHAPSTFAAFTTPGVRTEARRGLLHVPAMAWGAAKVGALLGGVAAKQHGPALATKWFAHFGSRKVLGALGDLNDMLLKSGVQDIEAHASLQQSINGLERRLASVAGSEQLRLFRQWVEDMEKQAPELVVALGHAYLDSFKSVKLAKAALKGYDEAPAASEKPVGAELIAGVSALEWERCLHAVFPELQNYSVVFIPK